MGGLTDKRFSLRLSLLHSSGPYSRPTAFKGQLWLHALRMPGVEAINAIVVDAWRGLEAPEVRDVELTIAQVSALWELLAACGLPERQPETARRVDTGDHYGVTWIRGSATVSGWSPNTVEFSAEIHEGSSGIAGRDARAVSALVRRLCELYGVPQWRFAYCLS